LNHDQQHTAVLIFASQSARDVVNKRMPQGQQLFDAFTAQTIAVVQEAGLPYLLHQDQDQKGCSFGSKFTHAVQSVFDQGFKRVITIGNDTPGLSAQHLLTAVAHLDQDKVTLGPSEDGGFYLMAMSESAFAKAETPTHALKGFKNLPWQQSNLLTRLCELIYKEGDAIELLDVLIDIDGIQDVRKLLAKFEKLEKGLLWLLRNLLVTEHTALKISTFKKQEVYKTIFLNKGSPSAMITAA
jgi:hypothetical protein